MSKRKKAEPLRVEGGRVEEDVRNGLYVRVPVFVFDAATRPDLAVLLRRGGSVGFFETPWKVDEHEGARRAVLTVETTAAGVRPFAIAFPLKTYGPLLQAALNADEFGLRPNTITALPPPLNRLTAWIRGKNEMLHAILQAEN